MNQPLAWQEIVRMLKPGGVSVHVIPRKMANHRAAYQGTAWGAQYSNATVLFFTGNLGVRLNFSIVSSGL
jgi:hypothetical protein